MTWLDWYASRHTWLVHLPWAAALLLIVPVLAAQRGGRGIRPWWTTCRYLAGIGLAAALITSGSGLATGSARGLLAHLTAMPAPAGLDRLVQVHGWAGLLCLLLAAACLRSLYRKRQDHQGIGWLAVLLTLVWGMVGFGAVYSGRCLSGRSPAPACLLGESALRTLTLPPYR